MPVGHDVTWNEYFMGICDAVSRRSTCLSRKIGAIVVNSDDHTIIATGYNGPPRGFHHCEGLVCPRVTQGYGSGKGLEYCPAVHAEANCVADAALNHKCVDGQTLILNTVLPCKSCMGLLINAGIKQIVYKDKGVYDQLAKQMAEECNIKLTHYLERSNEE